MSASAPTIVQWSGSIKSNLRALHQDCLFMPCVYVINSKLNFCKFLSGSVSSIGGPEVCYLTILNHYQSGL